MNRPSSNSTYRHCGDAVMASFEDQFLLSVIDAHRPDAMSDAAWLLARAERLRVAKEALFGRAPQTGRQTLDDAKALRWMAAEQRRDEGRSFMQRLAEGAPVEAEAKARSIRDLAKQASRRFFPSMSDASERLRKKYSAEKDYWLEIADTHDDVAESLQYHALIQVQEILQRFGVNMDLERLKK